MMDMNMALSSATSTSDHVHHMPSMGPQTSMSATNMPGMASTFTTNTRVTLWFTEWTTTTTATYVLTIFFLFFLGIFNRFLRALKSQLDREWRKQRETKSTTQYSVHTETPVGRRMQGHARQWSRILRIQPPRLEELDQEETEPLSPAPNLHGAEDKGVETDLGTSRRFWVANAPWSVKRDGMSAILEFTRALIGYILYAFYAEPDMNYLKTHGVTGCLPS
jgi:hypothetical protein